MRDGQEGKSRGDTGLQMQCFLPVAVHESGVLGVELQQGLHTHVDATAGKAAGWHHPRTAKVKVSFFVRNSLEHSL